MASRHDMPDMRTLDEVSPAPEEPLPPPRLSDGAAMAQEEPSATSPPLDLSGAARAWWRATAEEFELEPHHVRTLTEAAFAWDRCQQARSLVNQQGLVVQDPSGRLRPHRPLPSSMTAGSRISERCVSWIWIQRRSLRGVQDAHNDAPLVESHLARTGDRSGRRPNQPSRGFAADLPTGAGARVTLTPR